MKIRNLLFLCFFTAGINSYATQPITRNFSSVRAQGMGNVRYTTGLYEENFFANPARVTANPEKLFQLPKVSVESNYPAIKALREVLKGSGGIQQYVDSVGDPISARLQIVFPGYYNPTFMDSHWGFGVAIISSAETHSQFSETGTIDPASYLSVGPAISLGRRLLENDRLSIGATMHTEYHQSIQDNVSIVEFLGGKSIRGRELGGNGLGIDFDLGTSFQPHWTWLGASYEVAFAVNNILGGAYKNLGRPNSIWDDNPIPFNRTYNFGVSMSKQSVFVLDDLTTAFEITDIGNNLNGSIFRLIHLGTEARWGLFTGRLGINQGYLCAGFGWSVGFIEVNVATYGEEITLNAGGQEDRRYAIELGFQI